jgi:phosphoribosylformylglycinamidine synthase
VTIRKIDTVADPEGTAITEALGRLGYNQVSKARSGRFFFVNFEADGEKSARELIEKISREVLTNPIIEKFEFDLEEIG